MVLDLVYCLTISSRTPAYLSSEVRANIGASRKEDVNHLPINFSKYYLFNNEAILVHPLILVTKLMMIWLTLLFHKNKKRLIYNLVLVFPILKLFQNSFYMFLSFICLKCCLLTVDPLMLKNLALSLFTAATSPFSSKVAWLFEKRFIHQFNFH